jgi:hypothetical protein
LKFSPGLADNRTVPAPERSLRVGPRLLLLLLAGAGAIAGCTTGNRGKAGPVTLESARRLRYFVAPAVAVDPNGGGGPRGTPDQLRAWVAHYMTQVGLAVAQDAQQPHDVEVQLALSAHGALVLYGTAGMRLVADGQAVDQWTTGEHVEPGGTFARALARELVETMVHSTRLAAHADARTAGQPVMVAAVAAPQPAEAETGGEAAAPAAAEPNGATVDAARAHTRQGSAYYDLNRYQEAYGEFEQAYLLEQDPALLYNMGQCQRKLGNAEQALHFYRTYLRRAPQGPLTVEAEKRVRELDSSGSTTRGRH